MRKSRYLDVRAFCREVKKLKACTTYVSPSVLERLERQRSLVPKLRLRYPDEIERRWWAEAHPNDIVAGPIEPDGPRWDDACALETARQAERWHSDPSQFVHPLDAPEPRFRRFVQRPKRRKFIPWRDYRVDVGDSQEGPLYTSDTAVTYYSAWQILLFAEVVNMGVLLHLNLELTDPRPSPEAMQAAPSVVPFEPLHAMGDFKKHEHALDGIIWFAEEAQRGYMYATRHDHSRRMLTQDEADEIMRTRLWAAKEARRRHGISYKALLDATKFLCERWAHWNGEGRPLIAGAYKSVLADAVRLCQLTRGVDYAEIRREIGRAGGYFKPILDVIWEHWEAERRADTRRILASYRKPNALLGAEFSDALIDRFLDFLEKNSLHGFYWRLESFNRHAFHGNSHSIEGLKGDVQGMAVVVEHIASALGARKPQLRDKFKELWAGNPDVLKGLKDNRVMKIGNGKMIDLEWFEARQGHGAIAETCADLAISYAIRGGAHRVIAENNPLRLERMMLILLRATLKTFDAATTPRTPTRGCVVPRV